MFFSIRLINFVDVDCRFVSFEFDIDEEMFSIIEILMLVVDWVVVDVVVILIEFVLVSDRNGVLMFIEVVIVMVLELIWLFISLVVMFSVF